MKLQTWARIVAIVELILSAISLKVLLYYFMFGVKETYSASKQIQQDITTWLMVGVLWLPFFSILIVLMFQYHVAVNFFISAKSLQPVEHAFVARFWRNVTFIFIVCAMLHAILGPGSNNGTILLTIVTISVRTIGLAFLHFRIKFQLDELAKNESQMLKSPGCKSDTGFYDLIYTEFPMELTTDGDNQNMNIKHCQTV